MIELAARSKTLPPPPHVLWPGSRAWLELAADEIEPVVVDTREPDLVVWSTLWPDRPDDRIELTIASDGSGSSSLTFRWTSPDPEPDGSTLGRRRLRLSQLFWAELRYSFGH